LKCGVVAASNKAILYQTDELAERAMSLAAASVAEQHMLLHVSSNLSCSHNQLLGKLFLNPSYPFSSDDEYSIP
jgi:hypothetical protein